jgi:predicted MFS family arabinose efflux permease
MLRPLERRDMGALSGKSVMMSAARPDSEAGRPLGLSDSICTSLGGLIAMAAALGIGRFVYTPVLPPMIEALHLSKSEAGLIASANFVGYLLGALLAAMPGLVGSRRLWLLGALAISAVTTAAMGLTQMLPAFLGLRLIGGIASAFVLILSSTIVLDRLAEAGRSGLSALHFAGVGTGITVSAVLVAELQHLGESWQMLWLTSGAVTFVALLAAAGLLPEGTSPTVRSTREGKGAIDRGLRRLMIAYGLFGFGYVITATFLVAIVRATPTIRPFESVIWIVFGIAAVPSVTLWTRLAQSIGIPATFAIVCVVEAAGVLASVAWPTTPGVFLAAILVGGTFMGLTALGLMGARARAIGDPRRALALMTGAFGVGQIIGPIFAGFVSDRLGSFTASSIVAALALLAAALLAAA